MRYMTYISSDIFMVSSLQCGSEVSDDEAKVLGQPWMNLH